MAVPTNKAELVAAIQKNYTKLREDLETTPPKLTEKKEMGFSKIVGWFLTRGIPKLDRWKEK